MDPDLRRGDDVLKVQHLHPELPYHPVTLTRATPPMEGCRRSRRGGLSPVASAKDDLSPEASAKDDLSPEALAKGEKYE